MVDEELCRNLDSAIRSNEIEGHVFTKEEMNFFARIKSGEISLNQALDIILSAAGNLERIK
ncbi:MAG: antitoxin VbhA family protein [Lachnospiraceae bacterium]|nr:antitoxin VbhA family protein [Lachnospiraceae bacterium]